MTQASNENVATVQNDNICATFNSPWLDSPAAADYIKCTSGTLKTWRCRGEGPKYHVINKKLVRYHVEDLDAFIRGEVAR